MQTELVALPSELLTDLEQTATRLDMEVVDSLIDEVRPHNIVVADILTALANDFGYDQISTLIQEAKIEDENR